MRKALCAMFDWLVNIGSGLHHHVLFLHDPEELLSVHIYGVGPVA